MKCSGYRNSFYAVLASTVLLIGSVTLCASSAYASIDRTVRDLEQASVDDRTQVTVVPLAQLPLKAIAQLSKGIECTTLDQIQALAVTYFASSYANRASGWYAYLAGCRIFAVELFIVDTRKATYGTTDNGLVWQLNVLGVHQGDVAGFVPY